MIAARPPGFRQLGSTRKIAGNDSRIQDVVYRNGSLWTTHHVFLPAGVPTRSSVQWWQITPTPAGPAVPTGGTVNQFGRVDDPTGFFFREFPSIAVNVNNDVLIGYSQFSPAQFPSSAFASRKGTDPANQLFELTLKPGEAKYDKDFGAGENRWGDYSNTVVDPVNDNDMWKVMLCGPQVPVDANNVPQYENMSIPNVANMNLRDYVEWIAANVISPSNGPQVAQYMFDVWRFRADFEPQNEAISRARGAPPETNIRSRPPVRALILEKTSRSARANSSLSRAPGGVRSTLCRNILRPTPIAQRKIRCR